MAEGSPRSTSSAHCLPHAQNLVEPPSNAVTRDHHKGVTYSPIRQERKPNGSTKKHALAGPSTASEPSGFPFGHSLDTYEDGINGNPADISRLRGIADQLLLRRASADLVRGIMQDEPTKPVISESSTPQGPPIVQFSRPAVHTEQSGSAHRRSGSGDFAGDETVNRSRRGGALFNKLKAFASPPSVQSHKRASSGFSLGRNSVDERRVSHLSEGDEPMNAMLREGESDLDADAEESTGDDDATGSSHRRRRKSRRPQDGGPQTAPTTPKTMPLNLRPGFFSTNSMTPNDKYRPSFLPRRATMTDLPTEGRQGVSEDEGRDKIRRAHAWRRGSAWVHGPRGLSYAGSRKQSQQTPSEERRPSNLRRLTGFGTSNDGTDSSPFSPWKGHRGERATTISAAKWRQLKAGLKMLGQRRKAENTIDHAKSAELLAELTAGVPAALILASMFQRDEHGNKRIPILLEQLKVRLTDSQQVSSKSGERHMIFRIEMEYGNGLTRMKWVIHRALRDFVTLHTRYKIQIGAQKYVRLKNADARTKLPRFPRSAFPYLRDARGLKSDSEDEEDGEGTGPSGGEVSGAERASKRKGRPSLGILRRKSSATNVHGGDGPSAPARKDAYPERQRKKLELYLQQMIRYLIFRPESNRLCKFLELSALGVRLAAEGSYHGKEGLLIIQSGKGVDFRKAWTPSLLAGRHGPKWFSVRHSYVVCVDSPEEMNIYDVFLVDSSFRVQTKRRGLREHKPKDMAKAAKESASHPKHHSLKLYNSERKLKLLAKTERQLHQFEESIKWMLTNTSWAKPKRFDSFAPVRSNVFAQWLVDGRDYMWNVSRAISMAKDVIYIHDWWLSPELYMRRPAAISQKWRLDRLLQRKAREGVKVFVIMYRNINSAIPIDSEYTKFSLLDLHHNVFVQRSPNQFRQNTFFWAHHEKICIVDHMVAFVGGIDLCFGRWDTPQHSVVDDKLTGFEASDAPKDADHCQLWPGKDYSNPRVQDFYALGKPYEEMYDRSKIPRMPWHDIHMQIVGQPARDLTRHFVQRWNYILRQRKPTRPTPFLLPPPDFQPADLEALGLNGTCEVQILRSACWWSLGTPNHTEHSIMNAYIKTIEQSEHFVYIENQFFISSCEVEGTRVENHIGDALVERIVRASQRRESWRAVIVIPLMPGFQNTVDQQDGTSIRLIMQCQYRSICRGEASIFGRVRAQGIEPEDYIQFYSLRSWGRIGPNKQLVTEQLYIHAKCMVVDDRIVIIGSANINERSMLGSRDSECAAVVRDTDMLWSTMDGEPYLVGRFAHTLRMRLMREHLGIDVDEVLEDDLQEEKDQKEQQWENDMNEFHSKEAVDRDSADKLLEAKHRAQDEAIQKAERMSSFNYDAPVQQANNPNLKSNKKLTVDPRVNDNVEHKKDVDGEGRDAWKREEDAGKAGRRDTYLMTGKTGGKEVLLSPEDANAAKGRPLSPNKQDSPRKRSYTPVTDDDGNGNAALPPFPLTRTSTATLGLSQTSTLPPLPMTDDTDIGGPSLQRTPSQKAAEVTNPLVADMKRPFVDKDCMRDPLNDSFFLDTWHAVAENNTKLFRQVFRCMPDNDVKSWKEYKEYSAYAERFFQAQGDGKSKDRVQQDAPGSSGPPGNVSLPDKLRLLGPIGERAGDAESKAETFGEKLMHSLGQKDSHKDYHHNNHSMGNIEEWAEEANKAQIERHATESNDKRPRSTSAADTDTTIDEKVPFRSSNELRPATTFDSEATTKAPPPPSVAYSDALNRNTSTQKRRRRATTRSSRREFHASDDIIALSDADDLMQMVQGHLVLWPYDWLAREEQGGNWLYSIDGLAPLEI
ncbi:MAG: Phospholipase D1 [Alectoria sarmentosa]|nr:MAG: Phospholipase D1 [Alectoria sarmentosa]